LFGKLIPPRSAGLAGTVPRITSELNNTNCRPFELTDRRKVPADRWSWAAKKNAMDRNTAGGLCAACVQLLSVLDNPDEAYLEGVDIDDVSHNFKSAYKHWL
jgi:hypothetical protein